MTHHSRVTFRSPGPENFKSNILKVQGSNLASVSDCQARLTQRSRVTFPKFKASRQHLKNPRLEGRSIRVQVFWKRVGGDGFWCRARASRSSQEACQPGDKPGANRWFLWSTPIQMLGSGGSICGRLALRFAHGLPPGW